MAGQRPAARLLFEAKGTVAVRETRLPSADSSFGRAWHSHCNDGDRTVEENHDETNIHHRIGCMFGSRRLRR
jgi:hypothetical protein